MTRKNDKSSDHWNRGPDEIAARIESKDVPASMGTRPLVVFDGTAALVFSEGRLLGRLASGRHDIDGTIRRWLSGDGPTTVILVDEGDLALDVTLDELRCEEGILCAARMRLIVRLTDVESFYRNFLRDRSRLTREELAVFLLPELRDVALAFTSTRSIEALCDHAELHLDARDLLLGHLDAVLGRIGLTAVSITGLALEAPEFDEQRRRRAAIALQDRDTDLAAAERLVTERAREEVDEHTRRTAAAELDLEEALADAAHEQEKAALARADAFERERMSLASEREQLEVEQARARAVEDAAHQRRLAENKHQEEIARERERAIVAAEVRRLRRSETAGDWALAEQVREAAMATRRNRTERKSSGSIAPPNGPLRIDIPNESGRDSNGTATGGATTND